MSIGIAILLIGFGLIFYPAKPTVPRYDAKISEFASCEPCEINQDQIERIEKAHKKYIKLAEKKYGTKLRNYHRRSEINH